MPATLNEKKTVVQQLSPLIEWFLADKKVEIKFIPNVRKKGLIVPEFDFEWWVDGRRIQLRTLAMICCSDLQDRNYNFNLAKILGGMIAQAWIYYVQSVDYAPWIGADVVMKKPNGRPRTKPKAIPFDELRIDGILVDPGISTAVNQLNQPTDGSKWNKE